MTTDTTKAGGAHTPGPWKFHSEHVDPEWHIVTSAPSPMRGVIANVHIAEGNLRDLADARLIAAAPQLLKAARDAADVLAALYAKYQTKIGPFASQAQRANVALGAAIAAAIGEQR